MIFKNKLYKAKNKFPRKAGLISCFVWELKYSDENL